MKYAEVVKEKFMNFILIGVLLGVAIIGAVSRFIFKKTDNVVEQMAEKIIKEQTGYKVDLSPDTP